MTTTLLAIILASVHAFAEPRAPEGAERVAIGNYVRAHMQPLDDCYDRRLATVPTLRGKLILRFEIASKGEVAEVSADGMQDAKLIECVVKQVKTWQFEGPPAGVTLRVAYPISFQPG